MKPANARQGFAREKARLYQYLADGRWHKARQIPMQSRTIRELCSTFPAMFFSTQKGYKLTRYATNIELEESIADLRSRIKHLDERAFGLEGILHKRVCPSQSTPDLFA